MARTFNMRAWHTVLTDMVYWSSTGDTPDFAGAESGYTPGDLANIVVVNYVTVEGGAEGDEWLFDRVEEVDTTAPVNPGFTGLPQAHFVEDTLGYPGRVGTFTSPVYPGATGLPQAQFEEDTLDYPDRRTPDP